MRGHRPGQCVKQLPLAAIPEAKVGLWSAVDAERWRRARVPVIFAPVAGSWGAAVLVIVAYVLTSVVSSPTVAWPGGADTGTDWVRYPGAVLLVCLPLWYRHLPVLAGAAGVVVAADTGFSLASADGGAERAGYLLVLALCAWAFTGCGLRLRARRRQRELFLEAAGRRRFPLPERAPESDGYRGHAQVYAGILLCLVAAGHLIAGLVEDLTGDAYDAVGQQIGALLFLALGSTLYARGLAGYRAARRLHDEAEHPALLVGIRVAPDGRHWIHPEVRTGIQPDARTPGGGALISYVPRDRDICRPAQFLGSSSTYGLGDGHHSVDAGAEPFEAVLYGPVHEGAEIVVAYATLAYHARQETGQMSLDVTTATLLPYRRHRLGPWQPVDGTVHERARRAKAREDEARADRDRQERARAEHARSQAQRTSRTTRTGAGSGGGSTGSQAAGCGTSSGGGDGCGGGGGGGCGGCGG
ncbi:hypothetical protein [Streptomyces sp. N35]|uniref:hypothetical protein n=1 Tax=Streptomyces sp. N35 TaxID=2795730 RepID=UPI0018F361F6|nr:hypothetical protein [Streptomyces sp. N35]